VLRNDSISDVSFIFFIFAWAAERSGTTDVMAFGKTKNGLECALIESAKCGFGFLEAKPCW